MGQWINERNKITCELLLHCRLYCDVELPGLALYWLPLTIISSSPVRVAQSSVQANSPYQEQGKFACQASVFCSSTSTWASFLIPALCCHLQCRHYHSTLNFCYGLTQCIFWPCPTSQKRVILGKECEDKNEHYLRQQKNDLMFKDLFHILHHVCTSEVRKAKVRLWQSFFKIFDFSQ